MTTNKNKKNKKNKRAKGNGTIKWKHIAHNDLRKGDKVKGTTMTFSQKHGSDNNKVRRGIIIKEGKEPWLTIIKTGKNKKKTIM